MNELDEAVGFLDRELEHKQGRLAEAQAVVEELHTQVEQLTAERRALLAAIARVRGGVVATGQRWLDLSRTDAVEAVLREATEALAPAQITEQLLAHGRNDKADLVSAALSYLKRLGRAESPSYGRWVVAGMGPALPYVGDEPEEPGVIEEHPDDARPSEDFLSYPPYSTGHEDGEPF
jgi:hypothetical protein